MVSSEDNITKIKSILFKKNPKVIVLESEYPTANNRVIRYVQYLERNGWKKINIRLKSRHKKTKKRTKEFHIISVMLRLSYEADAEEIYKKEL